MRSLAAQHKCAAHTFRKVRIVGEGDESPGSDDGRSADIADLDPLMLQYSTVLANRPVYVVRVFAQRAQRQ